MAKKNRAPLTVRLERSLLERLRTASFAARLTVDELAGRCLHAAVEALERRYNGGRPFPPKDEWRGQELKQLLEEMNQGVVERFADEESE